MLYLEKISYIYLVENVERKIMSLQEEWMFIQQYEEKFLAPSISFQSLHDPEKIYQVEEFLEIKECIEIEREIYLMLFNAGIDIEDEEDYQEDYQDLFSHLE